MPPSTWRRRFFASPFLCARSESGDVPRDAAQQSEQHLREYVVCLWFGTLWLTLTWALILLNIVVTSPNIERWDTFVATYTVVFLTFRSYAMAAHTHPGAPPDEWEASARAGVVPSTVCKRSERLLPPRARYVGRAGEIIAAQPR